MLSIIKDVLETTLPVGNFTHMNSITIRSYPTTINTEIYSDQFDELHQNLEMKRSSLSTIKNISFSLCNEKKTNSTEK